MLLRQADRREFFMGAGNFAQGGFLRARHQNQARALRIGQRIDGGLVLAALLFEAGQGTQAGGIALAFVEKAAPGAGQLQQADGVAGGRRIEDDVVVIGGQGRVHEQGGEFVEGGDLGGAGAGELLLDALDDGIGQHPAHGADDAIAVNLRRGLRVDLQRAEVRNRGDGGNPVADTDTEHLADVGRRVGADQQHAAAKRGQLHGAGAGNRGLADAALAGEEQEARRLVEKFHGAYFRLNSSDCRSSSQPLWQLPAR